MIDKTNASFTIMEEDLPDILRVSGEENDPNFQDVPQRNLPKYLCEQYWIKQWGSTNRWKLNLGVTSEKKLRLADLDRNFDDPGDAFFELNLITLRSSVCLRTWVEVTEVFLPEYARKIKMFIREYNGLKGKGELDITEFLKSLNLGSPNSGLQREVADKVILAIQKKAQKGCEGGSYKSLVRDYGRGQLIVGLPMWFATFPADPTDPSTALTDFSIRLNLGLKAIRRSVLLKDWCPFDSVVVLWNPTLESLESWAKVANLRFYSDPVNQSLHLPIPCLKILNLISFPGTTTCHIRWDRYSSLDAMLANQFQRFRLFNKPCPLGPKACLEIRNFEGIGTSLRMIFYTWLFQLWLFVGFHGWHGLHRWVSAKFSVRRLYFRLRRSHQARKYYRSSSME